MKLELQDIQDRISKTEDGMSEYRRRCDIWLEMWNLKAFKETRLQALKDNREQVILPDPKNAVNLTKRLLASSPRIDVPCAEMTDDSEEASESRKRFLESLWARSNKEQGGDLIGDATWYGATFGRFAFDIRWVEEQLPKRIRGKRLPLLVRVLDPRNVGIKRGPLYTMWAYHKYSEDILSVRSRYPDLKLESYKNEDQPEKTECEIVDFWYVDPKNGSIWNAVLVDDEFAKSPWETDYPDIPIVVSGADRSPTTEEETKFEPILEPMRETWYYKCRLASQMATGLLWYFWPAIIVKNKSGRDSGDIEIGAGKTTTVRGDTEFDVLQMGTNMPMADQMMGMLMSADQQSTYPNVMYGDAGSMQAGFGVNMLLDSAKGRINDLRKNLEWAVSWINELALSLIEVFADEEGVSVWGYDESLGEVKSATISKEQINGFYENHVRLSPNLPENDIQKQTLGLRQVQAGVISKQTYRRMYISDSVPSTEEKRVMLEQAMASEENAPLIMNLILAQYFEDPKWKEKMSEALGMSDGQNGGQMSGIGGPLPPMPQSAPPPPPPPQAPPPPQSSVQPPPLMGPEMPPQMEGMITEDMLSEAMTPEMYQMLINGQMGGPVPTMDEIDAMDSLLGEA